MNNVEEINLRTLKEGARILRMLEINPPPHLCPTPNKIVWEDSSGRCTCVPGGCDPAAAWVVSDLRQRRP